MKGKVEVAEGLQISMDAETWKQEIEIGDATREGGLLSAITSVNADWKESEGSYRKGFEKTSGKNHENNYIENYENNYNESIKNNSGENSEENGYNSYRFRNLVECIIRNVYGTYMNSFENFIDYYREHSIVVGEKIYFLEDNIKVNATVRDIDPEGGLMVICENGEKKTLRSGEITVRLI